MVEMTSCEKDFCSKVFVPQIEAEAKRAHNSLAKEFKLKMKYIPMTRKQRKSMYDSCVKVHCNPSCVGTIFNKPVISAEHKKLLNAMNSKERANVMKAVKAVEDMQRKEIRKFKQPLENGFYRGLNAANVKTLKKSGAKSACTTVLTTNLIGKVSSGALKLVKALNKTQKRH